MKTPREAFELLQRIFEGFEESNLYEDYLESEKVSDEEYEEAWDALQVHFAKE